TVELLRAPNPSGMNFFFNDLFAPPRLIGGPWRLEFPLNQAFFDPLLPFTFKVLPPTYQGKPLAAADDEEFARNPVGSGPFVHVKPDKDAKGPVRLVVNKYHPYARQKSGFREIQFVVSRDPVAELSDPQTPLHLILGLTEAKIAYLKRHQVG